MWEGVVRQMAAPEHTVPLRRVTAPGPDAPVGTLRGAGVQVDAGRVGRVAVAVAVVAVAVTAVVLAVAGNQKNADITALRDHGVPVEATVADCLGLMGGSGSNLAGFECTVRYTVDGRTYHEGLPGNAPAVVGTTERGITVASDPALFSTPSVLASEHASWRVYAAPAALVVLLLLATGAILAVRRRRGPPRPALDDRVTLSHERT